MQNFDENSKEYDWIREMARKSLGTGYENCKNDVENFMKDYDVAVLTMLTLRQIDVCNPIQQSFSKVNVDD